LIKNKKVEIVISKSIVVVMMIVRQRWMAGCAGYNCDGATPPWFLLSKPKRRRASNLENIDMHLQAS
jgi:hypothetical protein